MTTYINSLNEDVNEIELFLNCKDVEYFAEADKDNRGMIKKIIDWFKNVFNKVWNWVKKTAKKLVRSLKKTASKIKNFVTGAKTSEVYSLDATFKLKEMNDKRPFAEDPDGDTEKLKDWADENMESIKEEIGKKSKEALSKENANKAFKIGVDLYNIIEGATNLEEKIKVSGTVDNLKNTYKDKSEEEIAHVAKKYKEAATVFTTFGTQVTGILKVYMNFVADVWEESLQ